MKQERLMPLLVLLIVIELTNSLNVEEVVYSYSRYINHAQCTDLFKLRGLMFLLQQKCVTYTQYLNIIIYYYTFIKRSGFFLLGE